METISDILNFSVEVFPVAFRKWEKVARKNSPGIISKCYLVVHTQISSYFFLLISSDEVAKVFRLEIFISKQRKKRKKCEKLSEVFKYFKDYSCDLEAHVSRHLADCFSEDISDTQEQIQVGHFFGK